MRNGRRRGGHVGKAGMAYALGGLRPTERARLGRHRRACPECDRLLEGHERAVARLPAGVRATPPPSPAVKAALLARVARAQASANRRATALRIALAAAVVAFGSGMLQGSDGVPPPPPTLTPLTTVGENPFQLFGVDAEEATVRLVPIEGSADRRPALDLGFGIS